MPCENFVYKSTQYRLHGSHRGRSFYFVDIVRMAGVFGILSTDSRAAGSSVAGGGPSRLRPPLFLGDGLTPSLTVSGADSMGHGVTCLPLLQRLGTGGAPWVEEQQTRNWPNCTDHHESVHKTTNLAFKAKKWRGTTVFGPVPPPHFQIRSGTTAHSPVS